MNIKKISVLALALIMVLLVFSPFALAGGTEAVDDIKVFESGDENDNLDVGIPEVSIDDVTSYVDRKGFQIITLLQRFAQPFSIIMFIGCAVLTIAGVFGNSNLVSKGIMGMLIIAVVYSVILNAPVIMDIILDFLRS